MSESAPESREALFAFLSALARAEAPLPERLAAARQGIRNGHLGPPNEATVEDGAGQPIPLLVWAASWGDLEMVELLLARGASPLAVGATGESALRAAHRHAPVFQVVRRAAREASERSTAARSGLATRTLERRYALRTDRGARDLRRLVEARRQLDVLLVAADLKTTVKALASLVQAPRREADVAGRPVQDAQRLTFLYRLKGIDWTIVPLVFEVASPWNVEHVTELAAAGSGISPLARAMARATERRVVHLKYDEHTSYSEHGGIETHGADAIDELGVLVPPMRVSTDGYHVQLELFGVDPSDVERVDLVVLQELGEPAIVRTIEAPAAAPSVVGAPVLLMPGLPARVDAPAGPRTEAPPLVREPIVEADLGPARSEAPPLVREPPPIVPGAAPAAPPPVVDASAAASEPPPPMVRLSEAPPLVRAPPPMVSVAVAPEEEPSDDEA